MKITDYEKKNYILKDKSDLVILSKVKKLENHKLNKKDKEIVKLIKTQLKKNWRLPLIKYLNRLIIQYKKYKRLSKFTEEKILSPSLLQLSYLP